MSYRHGRTFATTLLLTLAFVTGCGSKATTGQTPKSPAVYEEYDVTMVSPTTCLAASQAKFECPPGGTCMAPPPKPVPCPKGLSEGKTVRLIMAEDLTCSVEGAPAACPVHDGPVEVPKEE